MLFTIRLLRCIFTSYQFGIFWTVRRFGFFQVPPTFLTGGKLHSRWNASHTSPLFSDGWDTRTHITTEAFFLDTYREGRFGCSLLVLGQPSSAYCFGLGRCQSARFYPFVLCSVSVFDQASAPPVASSSSGFRISYILTRPRHGHLTSFSDTPIQNFFSLTMDIHRHVTKGFFLVSRSIPYIHIIPAFFAFARNGQTLLTGASLRMPTLALDAATKGPSVALDRLYSTAFYPLKV